MTLVATGALTNVALLLTLYSTVRAMICRALLMTSDQSQAHGDCADGRIDGCVAVPCVTSMMFSAGMGNTSPCAEFNIQIDPEAAKIVFDSGVPITMVPLQVTHTVLVCASHPLHIY